MDPATVLIWRALSGKDGKVEIGGRSWTFSCIRLFRLEDGAGRVVECSDSAVLLEKVLALQTECP